MADQIYIGNFAKGLKLDRLPFVIDNDAFPVLINAYVWRGRVKRKRGTNFLGRLQLQNTITGSSDGSGNFTATLSHPTAPGTISFQISTNTYTDTNSDGNIYVSPGGTVAGSINYLSGALSITGAAASTAVTNGTYSYFPLNPVMGTRDFAYANMQYPYLLAFDTVNSYQAIQGDVSATFYNVSYYKTSGNNCIWSGTDYQQFWTTNYESALWATNNKPGFHASNGTYSSGSATTSLVITLSNPVPTLNTNDKVFFNEWTGTCNQQVGTYVSNTGTSYTFSFASSVTCSGTGLVQFLTAGVTGQDGVRWYDGDPTAQTGLNPSGATGWVNFNPPLSLGNFGFDNLDSKIYYLVGATAIIPFKDRLLFFGPWIQSKDEITSTATHLADTVLWSWNGTPYFSSPTPLQGTGVTQYGSDPTAYYVDVAGKGGYLSSGTSQSVVTVNFNEDVLLVGFTNRQARLVYTSNDLFPFLFYTINSELGSSATFSGITLDRGALTIGTRGLALTSQTSSQRVDLDIPDIIFDIDNNNDGQLRVNAARDYFREWIYFTYPYAQSNWKYPTVTLMYNYRDNTFATFYENYTCHGPYRAISTGLTWANVGTEFPTWSVWDQPWNSSLSQLKEAQVCAGNQQGFVMLLDQGTTEDISGDVAGITALNHLSFTINSVNHCLLNGDYVQLQNINVTGGSTNLATLIGQVTIPQSGGSPDPDNFTLTFLTSQAPTFSGTYIGGGAFIRLSQPFIQTKQFPFYWEQGRQTRLGTQKYLFDRATGGEITTNIYLSTDPSDPWTSDMIFPSVGVTNDSLIYSNIMSTDVETDNLNSPNPPASAQYQIWHRINTSLIGSVVQIGFTLSDDQMRDAVKSGAEIALHGIALNVSPGPQLA